MDPIEPGKGQGSILAEALKDAGADCAMLNHAERPMTLNALVRSVERAREVGLLSVVCADSCKEAAMLAMLAPDILVVEPTELIGTGVTSDEALVRASTEAVKAVNPEIQVLQGAGISSPVTSARIRASSAYSHPCTCCTGSREPGRISPSICKTCIPVMVSPP